MGWFSKTIMTPYGKILSRYYGGLDVFITDVQQQNIDAYGISYPKCGRTWMKVFLQLLYLKRFGHAKFDGSIFYADNAPYMLFAHTGYYYNPAKPTIFIIRDPRDVTVSFYHHVRHRGPGSMHKYKSMPISDFIRDKHLGIPGMIRYYRMWKKRLKKCKRQLLVRYEDMICDDVKAFNDVVNFLGLNVSDKQLVDTVKMCRFENMKKEIAKTGCGIFAGHPNIFELKPSSADPNSAKVRRGKIGGYVDELGKADIDYFDRMVKKFPRQWRYE